MDGPLQPSSPPEAPERPGGFRRAGLFFLAFASGFAVLTIEIAGARLIAPVFGLSAVPWTAVIGVILAALAVGSYVGGRLADGRRVPLWAILVAAGFAGILPILGGAVPWYARQMMGFIGGAVVSAMILFAPAVLCLGAVVPYLIQADTKTLGRVGQRAGDVSAAATAGSIAGSFLTGFVLLPALPLPLLLGVTSAFLMGLAGLAGWILGGRAPAPMLALTAVGLGVLGASASGLPEGTLAQEQTLYASVSVREQTWAGDRVVRELRQNGGASSAEYVDTGESATSYVLVSASILEPVVDGVDSMLVLGGAALSLPMTFHRRRPSMLIDVVEIDPVVTRMAREYFAYGRTEPDNIRVFHDDARVWLRGDSSRYDVIYMDVFDNLLTVPWIMVTREALTDMAARMESDGLLMANLVSPIDGPGADFLRRFLATPGEGFPAVTVYPVHPEASPEITQNVIVVAALDPDALPGDPWPAGRVASAGRPLTDAWAPVEALQARLFLGGGR